MSQTLVMIDYYIDKGAMYIKRSDYQCFQHLPVIILRYDSYRSCYPCDKISSDIFRSYTQHKLLVIFATTCATDDDMRKSVHSHQRKLIGSNKNMCFGCLTFGYIYSRAMMDVAKHMPDDVSKFIIVHPEDDMYNPNINFDLRRLLHLQNLYHCFVRRNKYSNNLAYDIDNKIIDVYDKFDFKLSYGCTTKIIENFNEVVETS